MSVVLRSGFLEDPGVDGIVLPVSSGEPATVVAGADAADRLGVNVVELLARHGIKGECGEIFAVPLPLDAPRMLYLAGVGGGTAGEWRRTGAAVARPEAVGPDAPTATARYDVEAGITTMPLS